MQNIRSRALTAENNGIIKNRDEEGEKEKQREAERVKERERKRESERERERERERGRGREREREAGVQEQWMSNDDVPTKCNDRPWEGRKVRISWIKEKSVPWE